MAPTSQATTAYTGQSSARLREEPHDGRCHAALPADHLGQRDLHVVQQAPQRLHVLDVLGRQLDAEREQGAAGKRVLF